MARGFQKTVARELVFGQPEGGGDTSDATATASDIRTGKTAYGASGKMTGSFPGVDSSDADATEDDIRVGKSAYVDNVKVDGAFPGVDSSDADATEGDIRSGKTAYVDNEKLTGTLETLDTSDATAGASDISKDKTAYVNGVKITGSLVERVSVNHSLDDVYEPVSGADPFAPTEETKSYRLFTYGSTDETTGKTAISDSDYNSTYSAAKAIDDNAGTYWRSGTGTAQHWLGVDLGAGNEKLITTVKLTAQSTTYVFGYFYVEYSDDGSTWYAQGTSRYMNTVAGVQTFYIEPVSDSAHRYWRVKATSASANVQVQEMEFIAATIGSGGSIA